MSPSIIAGLITSTSLKVGAIAPDFSVTDTEGKSLVLSKLVAEGPVILAFFPKAFTGG